MKNSFIVILVIAFVLRASPVPADEVDQDGNIRCLVTGFYLAGNANPQAAQAGFVTALYWLGRLDGRLTDEELANRIIDMATKLTNADLQAASKLCGPVLSERGKFVTELGQRLSIKLQEMKQQSSPTDPQVPQR